MVMMYTRIKLITKPIQVKTPMFLNAGNGDKYKGEFVNGEKHGQGVETYADKKPKKDGLWVYGSFKTNKI